MKKTLLILFVVLGLKLFGQCPPISASYTPATCSSCCDGKIQVTPPGSPPCSPYTYTLQTPSSWSAGGYWINICPGPYTISIVSTCCSNSQTLMVTSLATAIEEISSSNVVVNFYPNPNNGDFIIKSETEINLTIVNELGQKIQQLNLNTLNNYKVQLTNLNGGMYFITSPQGKINKKIVVIK
ncbi:MAG TPA: T9SS type A sorting domain-containing protein [Bacteroidia bacterium]|jgi:hypothetical protein|nr:T9SS type A sorting domain-containing protein [Bacteroidia bacterium]